MKVQKLLKMLVMMGMFASFRAGAQLYVLDQSFASPDSGGADINDGFTYVAQTFTAGLSGTLTAVSVDIYGFGSGALPLHIQILGVTGGAPNSNVLGDTVLSTGSSMLSDQIFFPQVIPVTAGVQYAIVASYIGAPPHGAGQAQGNWEAASELTDYYPGGGEYFSNDGEFWNAGSGPYYNDQLFQTWVEPVPEPSTLASLSLAVLGLALTSTRRSKMSNRCRQRGMAVSVPLRGSRPLVPRA